MCWVQHDNRDFPEVTPTLSFPGSFLFSPPRWSTDTWRTSDRRPVYVYCNVPDHISRYCHRRIADEMDRPRTRSRGRYPDASSLYYALQTITDTVRPMPSVTLALLAPWSTPLKTPDTMRRHLFKVVAVERCLPTLDVPAQFLHSAMTLQLAANRHTRGRSLHGYRRSGCGVV